MTNKNQTGVGNGDFYFNFHTGMKIEVKITIADASMVFACPIFSSYSHIQMNK